VLMKFTQQSIICSESQTPPAERVAWWVWPPQSHL